ncbi:tetratricopeptide repeat protein [Mucilaginibacter sp. L3T2-6]|uniref:tetratricopeptide repeat protein n=1 Tax=Mucilaginibacter sp. L3T2-6 TaxID=3062491 RepID=UPI00267716E4|nr:tetratricopeptide repeat protein [Mucilaginibacter sp. L3T2-6]MDO3641563.1 tetratricopeptide repeat protein [Mucilaginibacter sp. L3T2-6]MDV6214057.1 tetratricopeptide repeat protein [Mucilaginibacter sp. L3T2-6]
MKLQQSHPDSSFIFAQEALTIARNAHNEAAEAISLNRLGVVLWKNGKYDRALQCLLASLKIREARKDLRGQLACLNNIGILYSDQNENIKALTYHFKAKAIAESLRDKKRLSIVLSNIGNCYSKLNKIVLALTYEMNAYTLQQNLPDHTMLPSTLSILGDIYYKMNHRALALDYYRLSAIYAISNNNWSDLADTYNSIALLYKNSSQVDSSTFYAKKALSAAQQSAYPIGIYNASNTLAQLYSGKNDHLELFYFKTATAAKDSMFNAEKIKQIQIMSFNEATRQAEIAEEKQREADERINNLQLIGIAIFIPSLFFAVLLLSKSKIHRRVIEFLSVLSLLLTFEFITLFIHPFVQLISNHLPIIELAILVVLASVLVPLHHRLTHWMHEKLVQAHRHLPPVPGANEPSAPVSGPEIDSQK